MRNVRNVMMAVVAGVALVFGGAAIRTAHAQSAPEYTWTLAAIGQGGWIGGPLFEDGTVGGGGGFSIGNGQLLARLIPTVWTEDADENISVCFDIVVRKGPADALPPSLCTPPTPPTGGPVHLELLGLDHIFRITELN